MWEKAKRREEQPGREKVQQAPRKHDFGPVNCGCCQQIHDDYHVTNEFKPSRQQEGGKVLWREGEEDVKKGQDHLIYHYIF